MNNYGCILITGDDRMIKNHRFTMYQNIIYDEGQIINPFECMKLLNYLYDEHIDLVKMNEQLREENKEFKKENKQLKKENVKFKEWEKPIRDVKREDLDRLFKMSIYEIAEAFNYYQKRIKELEE